MACFLVFTLAAPLMAFGDVAPGERRVGADRPGKSLLLGLVAAALGLRREDPRQNPLAAALAFAVRADSAGHALVDYHTAQTAPRRGNRRFATRREQLAVDDLGTILSQRSYLADAAFTVAALAVAPGPFGLEEIADALRRPVLPIHAGRRACPLGLPPSPLLVEADTLPAALAAYDAHESESTDRTALRRLAGAGAAPRLLAMDEAFQTLNLLGGMRVSRHEARRDQPVDRLRWQFAPRVELIAALREAPRSGETP